MSGKVVIYGGSGGIGSAIARRLHERGAPVHLVARASARLDTVAAETGASITVGDVLTDDGVFARAASDAGSPLAGLVYAIGSIDLKPFPRLNADAFLTDFRLNALGAAQAVQAALPALRAFEAGASVVMFSTVAVAQGFTGHSSVAMAKGAVEGLVRALAAELSPGVRVNAVAPSLTRTPLAAGLTANEQMAQAIAQMHAIPRLGTPEDIAALAAFLLSPEAGWITGQVMGVDGGRSTVRTKG